MICSVHRNINSFNTGDSHSINKTLTVELLRGETEDGSEDNVSM